MSRAGVRKREFARLSWCDEALVRRGLRTGRLIAFADGMLDPELAGRRWRRGAKGADGKSVMFADGELLSYPDAERLKENNLTRKEHYQALLRKLEQEVKLERLVDAAAVRSKVFNLAGV